MEEFKKDELAMWHDGVDYYVVKIVPRQKSLIEERTPIKILSVIKSVRPGDFLLGIELNVPTSNLLDLQSSFIYIFSEESW